MCVNGDGANGVMGALNEVCKQAGGRVHGVCHAMFVDGATTQLFDGMERIQVAGSGLAERKAELARGAHTLYNATWWPCHVGRAVGGGVRAVAGNRSDGPVVLVNTSGASTDTLLDTLSTAYHPHSQGSLSTRVQHGRGGKTANYGSTRVNARV